MFDLKNSFKNVKRNSKRYVIVGILIFIISFISVIALIVDQSSQATIEYYMNEYGSTATIDIDPEQLRSSFDPSQESSDDSGEQVSMEDIALTYDDYQAIAESDYVTDVSYEMSANLINTNLTTEDESEESDESSEGMPSMEGQGPGGQEQTEGSFSFIGSNTLEDSDYFSDENNVLVDGDYPTEDNQIAISSNLSELNDKVVGDTIKFTTSDEETTITMEVVGIYESVTQNQMMMGSSETIYTTYDTLANITDERSNITATYTLTSYDVVDEFESWLYDNGVNEMYYVNNNQELLEQIIGPVESTMSLLNNVMILVFIIGGAILVFINILILRERKYEIGVLRALGQKKGTVVKGLVYEASVVALIAMVFAIGVGMVSAQPIANSLLQSESTAETTEDGMEGPGGQGGQGGGMQMNMSFGNQQTTGEEVTSLDTSINGNVLLITFAINLLLMLITTFVSARFITRQEPNEILRER